MNSKLKNPNDIPSRLPHRVAIVLAAVVFPLIWVGGLVTTYDAGMAVPDWPGTYGYNMFLYPMETWFFGPFDLFVEHGHRLLGSLAGLVAIVLVVATLGSEPRRWVKLYSVALLLLVIAQGLLGGLRVLFDERTLAQVHGCVGPAFFASVAGFIVVTSRWWWRQSSDRKSDSKARRVRGSGLIFLSTFLLAASFGQLVVGAFLRHTTVSLAPNVFRLIVVLHIAVAVLLLLGTITQWVVSRLPRFKGIGIRGSINVLMLLVLAQVMLGVGTWVVKYGWPAWFAQQSFAATFVVGEKTFLQGNIVTAHVAVGSLILAFWTVHMLRCRWSLGPIARFHAGFESAQDKHVNSKGDASFNGSHQNANDSLDSNEKESQLSPQIPQPTPQPLTSS